MNTVLADLETTNKNIAAIYITFAEEAPRIFALGNEKILKEYKTVFSALADLTCSLAEFQTNILLGDLKMVDFITVSSTNFLPKKRSKKARIEDLEQRIAQLEQELRELRCQVLYHNTWPPIQPYYPPTPLVPCTPDPAPTFTPYQYPNTSGTITFPSETKC